jgi:hypothetical protein
MSRTLAIAVLVLPLAAAVSAAATRTAGKPLTPGQALRIAGTDVVCGYGGSTGHVGIVCGRNSAAGTRASWSLRLEETQLLVFRIRGGRISGTHVWHEPRTRPEPTAAGVTSLQAIGTARLGSGFFANGTDLGCGVARFDGRVGVGCAKRDPVGAPVKRSYGVELTQAEVKVLHVDAAGNVKTVWSAR